MMLTTDLTRCATDAALHSALLDGLRIDVSDDFADVECKWRLAESHCAHYVFQNYNWLALWQSTSTRAADTTPLLVLVSDYSGQILMLLPLGIRRFLGRRALVFLGEGTCDYNAPLIDPVFAATCTPAEFAGLWEAILKSIPPIDLVWFVAMPEVIEGARNPMVSLRDTVHTQNAHAGTLPNTFEAYRDAHKSNIFADAARKRRKIASLGEVSFEVLDKPGEIIETTRLAVAQKQRRYGKISVSPAQEAFYLNMAVSRFDSGRAHVCRLRVGDAAVASHVGVVYGSRFYWLVPGYQDGDWTRYSVGRLLMVEIVKWCISEGLSTFDMTAGDEDYKRFWADTRLALYSCRYAVSVSGRAAMTLAPLYDWAAGSSSIRALINQFRQHSVAIRPPNLQD